MKNYGYAYKKYGQAYTIFTLVGLFYFAFYRTCVFQHAYIRMRKFYARQRLKYGHGMRIFQAFINFFLRCDVTWLLSETVMLLAYKTLFWVRFYQNQNFLFLKKRNKLFLQLILGSFVWKFIQLLKLGLNYFIN